MVVAGISFGGSLGGNFSPVTAYVLSFILSAGLQTYPIVQVATMLTRALTFILRAVKGHQPISRPDFVSIKSRATAHMIYAA